MKTSHEKNKAAETRLNSLVYEWSMLDDKGNSARKKALREQIFIDAFEVFHMQDDTLSMEYGGSGDDAIMALAVFDEALRKYNPEKGLFSHYYNYLRGHRKFDKYKDLVNRSDRFDKNIGNEDGEATVLDTVGYDTTEEILIREHLRTKMNELIAMVINFSDRHKGKENNPARRGWYRVFFTEDIVYSIKEFSTAVKFDHERDVFTAMNTGYLDYFMSDICRTVAKINHTELKLYDEIVDRGKHTETLLPLPADVSIFYYLRCENKKMTRSNRSNYYKAYKEEKEHLGE